jgi:hypothetical protein
MGCGMLIGLALALSTTNPHPVPQAHSWNDTPEQEESTSATGSYKNFLDTHPEMSQEEKDQISQTTSKAHKDYFYIVNSNLPLNEIELAPGQNVKPSDFYRDHIAQVTSQKCCGETSRR